MKDLINQGAVAFKSGDIETARKLLTDAVKQFPFQFEILQLSFHRNYP